MIPDMTSAFNGSGAHSPRPKHLSQIEGVHHAISVEVGSTPIARPPGTQQNRQIKRFDLTVPIKALRVVRISVSNRLDYSGQFQPRSS